MDERRRLVALSGVVLAPQIALTVWLLQQRLVELGKIVPICDFAAFYTGGTMANEGRVVAAYDAAAYQETMARVAADLGQMFWLYPPTMVPIAQAFSQSTYWIGCVAWLAVGALGSGLAAYRLWGWKGLAWMFAFPPTVIAMVYAQASLWLVLFLSEGLRLLEERPIVAGALFGALSVKPHWLMLVVIALAAGRHVRALFSAGVVTVALALGSVAAYGIEPWHAWTASVDNAIVWVHEMARHDVVSVYSAVPEPVASPVQAVSTTIGLAATAWVFATRHPHDVRMAIVPVAMSLTSPYMHFYDLVALVIPAVVIAKRLQASGQPLLPVVTVIGAALWSCRVVGALFEFQPYPLFALVALAIVLRLGRGGDALEPAPAQSVASG